MEVRDTAGPAGVFTFWIRYCLWASNKTRRLHCGRDLESFVTGGNSPGTTEFNQPFKRTLVRRGRSKHCYRRSGLLVAYMLHTGITSPRRQSAFTAQCNAMFTEEHSSGAVPMVFDDTVKPSSLQ